MGNLFRKMEFDVEPKNHRPIIGNIKIFLVQLTDLHVIMMYTTYIIYLEMKVQTL